MSYCQNCGKLSTYGRYCMECGAELEIPGNVQESAKIQVDNRKKRKTVIGAATSGIAVLIVLVIILAIPRAVDEPCDWCGRKPSYAYHSSQGETVYVCEHCRERCAICGEEAETHYENMFGMPVYVCRRCYKRVLEESGH